MSTSFLKSHRALFATAGILILGCAAWGVVSLTREKGPAVPKDFTVEALKAKSEDPGQLFEQVHQAMNRTDLTEEQRHAIRENVHTVMEVQMDKRLDEYFAAAQPQRQAILDRHLDEMQAHMKEWQQRREQRQRAENRVPEEQRADHQTPGGPFPGRAGGQAADGRSGGPPGRPDARGPRQHTREERKQRSESRDPDKSARRLAYFSALHQRAEQRGIQMPFGPGRGRGH